MFPGSQGHSLNPTSSTQSASQGKAGAGERRCGGRSLLSSITLLVIIQPRSLVGFLQPEAPTALLPCPDKVHPCCFPKGPPEQDSCTPSLCHARPETTCSCRAGTIPAAEGQ